MPRSLVSLASLSSPLCVHLSPWTCLTPLCEVSVVLCASRVFVSDSLSPGCVSES